MDEVKRALAVAIRVLARRDHSAAELARKVEGKGFSPDIVAAVVARLTTAGYLDDRRFARLWAESALRNGRGYGPRIRLELLRRGVDDAVVAEVMADLVGEYDETGLARGIMAKKFPSFVPAEATDREKRRVMDYLKRRGFSGTVVLAVFQERQGC